MFIAPSWLPSLILSNNITMKVIFRTLVSLVFLSTILLSCANDDNRVDENISSKAIGIYLTDCPYDADEINVELLDIRLEDSRGVFSSLGTEHGIYNLLDFQNGLDVLIANGIVALNDIQNLYLELGDDNSIVIDGQSHELILDEHMIKVKFALGNILGDGDFLIEFYACNSIVESNGEYLLKPVIKFKGERKNGGGSNNSIFDLADLLEIFEDCYEVVYPFDVADEDGIRYTIDDQAGLNEVLVNNDGLKLIYPVDLISSDGETVTIVKENDFETLALDCFEENSLSALEQILVKLKKCYELVYPMSFKSVDGQTYTVVDESELVRLFNEVDIKDVVFPISLLDDQGNEILVESYEDLIVSIINCQ